MRRALGLGLVGWVAVAAAGGCTGAQGAMGQPGPAGTVAESVSAITPPYAFVGRTVELSIAGSGTSWSDKTTVAFGAHGVKVNKVTVASETGLLVNVTVGADAAAGATDVTVTDGSAMEVYKGAFEVKAPLDVNVDQPKGVPQGGLATVSVAMLDLTTPFDPNTATATLSSQDVTLGQPNISDYALAFGVQVDVLAQPASVDLDITSGAGSQSVDSQEKKAFSIVARAPTKLTMGATGKGTIATVDDTALYQYAPGGADQRFVQLTVGSMQGQVMGTAIPKSGRYADALTPGGFFVRYAQGTTSTDPFYVVVSDAVSLLGVGPTPADSEIDAFESPCTAVTGTTPTSTASPQAISTLPALVSDQLTSSASGVSPNYYAVTVSAAPKIIHVATGGDFFTDTLLDVLDPNMASLGPSDDLDYQEDLAVKATNPGTYIVVVQPGQAFSPPDVTYQLFIDVHP